MGLRVELLNCRVSAVTCPITTYVEGLQPLRIACSFLDSVIIVLVVVLVLGPGGGGVSYSLYRVQLPWLRWMRSRPPGWSRLGTDRTDRGSGGGECRRAVGCGEVYTGIHWRGCGEV